VPVYAYRFTDENKKTTKYWRDIGTLDAYYEANMDLCRGQPGVQPLRSGMAAADAPGAGAAGEVRVRRTKGRRGRHVARLDDLGRLHHLGQLDPRQRAVPQRARAQLLPGGGQHLMPGVRSAVTRASAAPSSTATCSSRAARWSATTRTRSQAPHRQRQRHRRRDEDDKPFIGPIDEGALRIEAEFDDRGSH
jgi:hypothetical protein